VSPTVHFPFAVTFSTPTALSHSLQNGKQCKKSFFFPSEPTPIVQCLAIAHFFPLADTHPLLNFSHILSVTALLSNSVLDSGLWV
jgi:hypothetical protein